MSVASLPLAIGVKQKISFGPSNRAPFLFVCRILVNAGVLLSEEVTEVLFAFYDAGMMMNCVLFKALFAVCLPLHPSVLRVKVLVYASAHLQRVTVRWI